MMNEAPLLELDQVTIERETTRILDRINLTIPRGRHTAILGPNGSGKSSLLKVLVRQFYPSVESDGQQGEVRILGRSDWDVAELRRKMGVVSSALDYSFSLGRTGRMTAEQAVASGFTSTELPEFGVEITDDVRVAVLDALDRVGESHLMSRRVETLSTGERRRVLIARALVHRPEILVLDEPTSGLDIAACRRFLTTLRKIVNQADVTLVLVTHHVEEVLPEIMHVVLLDEGRVHADDHKDRVLTSERLSEVFRIAIDVKRTPNGYSQAILK